MHILITGGRGGIAYQVALELAKRKHIVYLTVHTKEQLKSLNKDLNIKKFGIIPYKIDITNKRDLKLLDKLKYDLVWAHAGIGNGGTLLNMSVDVLRDNYETNVFGTMEVIRRAYLNFKRRNIRGKIFVTSSLAGMLPLPYLSCYTSSKAALSNLCRALKKEMEIEKENISISLIEPGAYKTGFNEVMIDNKEMFLNNIKDHSKYERISSIQRFIFNMVEKENLSFIVSKIVTEMISENPKFIIRIPISQAIFTKLYFFLFE